MVRFPINIPSYWRWLNLQGKIDGLFSCNFGSTATCRSHTNVSDEHASGGTVYRTACPEDYEAVMDINKNIYNGTDFVPHLYHGLLSSSNITGYLAEQNGEVACFAICHVVDSHTTLVGRAGRTKPSIKGQGIMSGLLKFMSREESRKYPSIRTHSLTKMIDAHEKPEFHENITEVMRSEMFLYKLNKSDIPTSLSSKVEEKTRNENSKKVTILSTENLCEIISSETLSKALFPEGIAVIGRVPYQIDPNNAEMITAENEVFATFEKGGYPSNNSPQNNPVFLSTVMTFPCLRGLYTNIDLFCCGGDSIANMEHHVTKHVCQAVNRSSALHVDCLHFGFVLPREVSGKEMKKLAARLGLQPSYIRGDSFEKYSLVLNTKMGD